MARCRRMPLVAENSRIGGVVSTREIRFDDWNAGNDLLRMSEKP
jgi:hypothetical protein